MISVITPFHAVANPYIREAYDSLCKQTTEWEWILGPNSGGIVPADIEYDTRVRVIPLDADAEGVEYNQIGRLKGTLAECARGDITVELDADDILMPDCLKEVMEAFEDEKIKFAYSNDAEFEHGTWRSDHYSEYWGWRWRPFIYENHVLSEMIAFEPSPHMMRFIWWAPDHVRAWRTDAYRQIGGYDKTLRCGDDHDLMCRFAVTFGFKAFKHIDKCLYLYRVHGLNTVKVYNAEIQQMTERCYLKYSRALATVWAKEQGLRLLELGGRFNYWDNYERVDLFQPCDVQCNLEEDWPFPDNSVGVVHAGHIFEHLPNIIHTMNELYRVLAPGGWAFIDVPSTDGRGAFMDPTHVSFFNELSFNYYTDANYRAFIEPRCMVRFQKSRVVTWFPDEWHKQNNLSWVQADLIALKDGYHPVGEVKV